MHRFALSFALFLAALFPARATSPVFLTGTSASDTNPFYDQETFSEVYVGKTLVLPIVVSGSGPMSYSVSTSNPAFQPVIKTGYPAMTINVTYSGSLGVLYSFTGGSDGGNPYAGVVQANDGNLYGTTESGSTSAVHGAVYQFTTSGSLNVLHSFTGGADGGDPYAGLIQASDGNLYGTASQGGGASNAGTVFQITTSGSLTTLYPFTGGTDGGTPYSGLVQGANYYLYGTTAGGGASGAGTVFSITTTGSLTTLYSFSGGADGGSPYAGLTLGGTSGDLYGTTRDGGGPSNAGTVFQVTTSGSLTTLHSFTGGADGGTPYGRLVAAANGDLHGTTETGGASGFGTVYQITTSGSLTTLYSFTGGADGGNPYAGLIQGTDGALYGTTESSGTSTVKGTLFSITTSGSLSTLYSFTGGSDGGNPYAGVTQGTNGVFYGTTESGGTNGYGTLYQLAAPFSGAMKFALLRDMAPTTTGYIAGLAQAGYYNNNQFFRITNVSSSSEPLFIAQGGDPTNTGTGNPGFSFDNEFNPSLIFTGQGQLAMANAGIDETTFRGTNGSQFFITQNPIRPYDFAYTLFGQLLQGFDVMQKVMSVPLQSDGSSPVTPVVMSSVTVSEDDTDAILLLSAGGSDPTGASIVINATDPSGNKAVTGIATTPGLSLSVFTANDSVNDPPYIEPVPNVEAALHQQVSVPMRCRDLEFDFLLTGAQALSNPDNAILNVIGNTAVIAPRASSPRGSVDVGLDVYQPLTPTERSSAFDLTAVTVGLGTGKLTPMPALFLGNPGAPLVPSTALSASGSTSAFGSFVCSNPASSPSDFAVTVNWGDGTVVTGTGNVSAVPSNAPGTYNISTADHAYANPGIYPVHVTVSDTNGGVLEFQNTAVVSAGPIYPYGRNFTAVKGLANGVVATFVDGTRGVTAPDYQAFINWGDGAVTQGTIKGSGGSFTVYGKHKYAAGTTYPVDVTIQSLANSNNTGYAWSTATLSGVPTHQPPFAQSHINGQLGNPGFGSGYLDEEVTLVNSGNIASGPVQLRFYLSPTSATDPISSGAIPLAIGKSSTYNTPPIAAGSAISGAVSDIVLPSNAVTRGKFIIMQVITSDPIGSHMPYPRAFADPNPLIE